MAQDKTSLAKARCRTCGGLMQKNYDHVGDCSTGNCSGSFAHVRPMAKPCIFASRDVGHTAVVAVVQEDQ